MGLRLSLFLLSLVAFGAFTIFSYTVAKEIWQQVDFDTTVKLQDRIPRHFDEDFSYLSLIGSVEVTLGLAAVLAFYSLVRRKFWAFLGWLMIIPATMVEVLGKLILFHPATPVLFHRNILETDLPSFYVETNFSYPSGHMTRTIFLLTVFLLVIFFSRMNILYKFISISAILGFGFMMALTRVYLGEHWVSDVIGGSLLGMAAGLFSSALIIAKRKKKV